MNYGRVESVAGAKAVFCEPTDEEASTYKSWDQQNQGHDRKPPCHRDVDEQEVGLRELDQNDQKHENSDDDHACLDWKAAATQLV